MGQIWVVPVPEEGVWASLTYHCAAERPEPPEQSHGQQQQQDEQGDHQERPVSLGEGRDTGTALWEYSSP